MPVETRAVPNPFFRFLLASLNLLPDSFRRKKTHRPVVMVGVIADHMARPGSSRRQIAVLLQVSPDDEEGGLGLVALQEIQDPRGIPGVGAVIKG